jgi:hypothetical protein
MSNAVATKKSAELSTDFMSDVFADGDEGTTFSADEMIIPYIRLAQAMSPELKKKEAKYIEGLDEGDIFNNLTNEVYPGDTGINVIPCYVVTKYTEWMPDRGGFVQDLDQSDPAIAQRRRDGNTEILPNGNHLQIADCYFCLLVTEDEDYMPVVIDMKVSQMKVSKRWKSMIAMNKAKNPKTGQMQVLSVFSTMWKVVSVQDSNKAGQPYANYAISKVGVVENPVLRNEAKKFRLSVETGEAKVMAEDTSSKDDDADVTEDEIPF